VKLTNVRTPSNNLVRIISLIGQMSLEVYLLHVVLFKLAQSFKDVWENYIDNLVMYILICVMTIVLSVILRNEKKENRKDVPIFFRSIGEMKK